MLIICSRKLSKKYEQNNVTTGRKISSNMSFVDIKFEKKAGTLNKHK